MVFPEYSEIVYDPQGRKLNLRQFCPLISGGEIWDENNMTHIRYSALAQHKVDPRLRELGMKYLRKDNTLCDPASHVEPFCVVM